MSKKDKKKDKKDKKPKRQKNPLKGMRCTGCKRKCPLNELNPDSGTGNKSFQSHLF